MKYYDTHAHTNLEPLINEPKLLNEIFKNEIIFNCVGTSIKSSMTAIEQAKKFDNIHAIIGIHPADVKKEQYQMDFEKMEQILLSDKKYIVAVGETGLDYHYDNFNKEVQTKSFIDHIELAKKYNLPIVVHIRDAYEDCVNILQKYAKDMKVIIHCFSGDKIQAKKFIDLGFYISFSGIVTFKNATKLQEAAKIVPLNKLLVETDSPFLAPTPFRGKINSPLYIKDIVSFLSILLNVDENQLSQNLLENSTNLFLK